MSSSRGWSILALLIGVGGLGLSGYTLLFALPQKSGIQNIWYDSYISPAFGVVGNNVSIPNLNVIATVNPGESLHVIFNADVFLDLDGGPEYLRVFVSLNDILIGAPSATVGGWPDPSAPFILYDHISLHYSNLTISPGLYNVSMMAESFDASTPNSLTDMTLLVFTSK